MLGISSSRQGIFNFWKLDKSGIDAKKKFRQNILQSVLALWCDDDAHRLSSQIACLDVIIFEKHDFINALRASCGRVKNINIATQTRLTQCLKTVENKIYNSEEKWNLTSMRLIWSMNLANSVSNFDGFDANIIYGFLLRSMQAIENCLARFPMPSIFEISRDSFILKTAIICLIFIKREMGR